MGFGIIILLRVLFIACMVFIIGYVFGNFSKNATLKKITKAAAILAIVLFIFTNVASFRFGGGHRGNWNHCGYYQDSTRVK